MTANEFENDQLNKFIDNLADMTAEAVRNNQLGLPDLRSVLRFINNIVQVVGDAFEDVYMVLHDVSLLEPSDIGSDRFRELRASIKGLMARSRYRDAEEICSRLHHLSGMYENVIDELIGEPELKIKWRQIYYVLDAHEGAIINMVSNIVHEFDLSLGDPMFVDLPEVVSRANNRVEELNLALSRLQKLRNLILGLSGNQGLVELTAISDRGRAAFLVIEELQVGHRYHAENVGAGAQVAQGENINQALTLQQAGVSEDQLKEAFRVVFEAIQSDERLDHDEKEVAQEAVQKVLEATKGARENPTAVKKSLTRAKMLLGGTWEKMVKAMNSEAVQKTIGTIAEASVQASIKSMVGS